MLCLKRCSDRGHSRPGDMRLAAAANEAYAASLAVSELLGCQQCGGGRGQDEVPGGRGLGAGGPSTADARTRSIANAPSGLRGLGEGTGPPGGPPGHLMEVSGQNNVCLLCRCAQVRAAELKSRVRQPVDFPLWRSVRADCPVTLPSPTWI